MSTLTRLHLSPEMNRFVITARLRKGSADKVAQILREGPPFDIEQTSLERHEVFLAGDEVVFLFEGPHAEEEARRLGSGRGVITQAGRLAIHIDGRPRLPEEVFSWERPPRLEGVVFGAQPGPGDSEGGPVD